MSYRLVQVSEIPKVPTCNANRILTYFIFIFGCLVFFSVIMKFIRMNMKMINEPFKLFSGSDKDFICSKKCCATQWPTPVDINDDRINNNDIRIKYTTSNIQCNDGLNNTGCICVPNM